MADIPPVFSSRPAGLRGKRITYLYLVTKAAVSAMALKQGWVYFFAWAVTGKLAKQHVKNNLSTYCGNQPYQKYIKYILSS